MAVATKAVSKRHRKAVVDPMRQAVEAGEGAFLVRAGPGAGKTEALVQRTGELVQKCGVPIGEILFLAFGHEAVVEAEERVSRRLGGALSEDRPSVTTYHAFARHVLSRFGKHLGYSSPDIVDEAVRWVLLCDVIQELKPPRIYDPLRPTWQVSAVSRVIQQAKQELVWPDEYVAWATVELAQASTGTPEEADLERHLSIARVYERLQQRFREFNMVDYDDMLMLAVRLIREVPEALAYVRGYRYIMVDEYQDTNVAQAVMVEKMVDPKSPNLMVVADEDQAIYRFRGASRANIQRFREHFPKHTEIRMMVNHRSTPEIIGVAQAVIDAAKGRDAKTMVPVRAAGELIKVVQCPSRADEALAHAERCIELHGSGAKWSEMCIMHRNHADLAGVTDALEHLEIPYVYIGGTQYFQSGDVKDWVALLEAIDRADNSQAVMRYLNYPEWRMSDDGRRAVRAALRSEPDRPLVEILEAGLPSAGNEDVARGKAVASYLRKLSARADTEDARALFLEAYGKGGWVKNLAGKRAIERQQVSANYQRFMQLLDGFRAHVGSIRVEDAVRYFDLLRRNGREGMAGIETSGLEAVRLISIHSAKGLEFPHLMIGGVCEGRMPSRDRAASDLALPAALGETVVEDDIDAHLEEERRLFYVALTRAMNTLMVTWAVSYSHQGQKEKPSRFLSDVPKALIRFNVQPFGAPAVPATRQAPTGALRSPIELSYTAAIAFKECPRQYEYLNVWKIKDEAGIEAWFGDLLHRALRELGERKRAGMAAGSAECASEFERMWVASAGLPGHTRSLHDEGLKMLSNYVRSPHFAGATIRYLEHPVKLTKEIREKFDTTVRNRLDRVDERAEGPCIVDYKSGNPRSEAAVRYDFQLMLYALAFVESEHRAEVDCELVWLKDGSITQVHFGPEEIREAERKVWSLGKGVRESHAIIEAAEASGQVNDAGVLPTRPNKFRCGHCAFTTLCPDASI